jgi:transposase
MHRRHARAEVLAIYLRAQTRVLRMRVHSRVGRLIRKTQIRALVINGLRMKPRRNTIERMFCRLKDARRIATRYDKCANNFLSAVCLVALIYFWLK